MARLFTLGFLVTVDKFSRIPPLEAPIKPEWFEAPTLRQEGMVKAQTSMKVSPFDESTLKKIDKLRRAPSEGLRLYSFALADGVRWMPKRGKPFFEQALNEANDDAKKIARKGNW